MKATTLSTIPGTVVTSSTRKLGSYLGNIYPMEAKLLAYALLLKLRGGEAHDRPQSAFIHCRGTNMEGDYYRLPASRSRVKNGQGEACGEKFSHKPF